MEDEELKFQRGDLDSVMAAHPHVALWVKDFEAKYGSRPYYYGPLDRDARKIQPMNLIYITKEPIFVHMYRPVDADGSEGQTLWFGLEPQLTDEEENIRRTLIEVLLQEAGSPPHRHAAPGRARHGRELSARARGGVSGAGILSATW